MAEHLETRLATLMAIFSALGEKLERRIGSIETAIERTASETQAIIRGLSH